MPICDAILTGQPVLLLDSEELSAAYPNLAGSDTVAMLAFPLRSGEDQAFGALALRFDAPAPRPEMAEIELLHIAADVCTQTVLRLRAEASSAERLRRIEFLSSASEQLARSLDHHATMQTVAELAVSSVADWCGVQLLEDGRLHSLVVAHSDPELAAAAHRLMTRVPTNPNAEVGSYAVARTGRSQLYSPVTVELIQRVSQDPELVALAEQLALQSVIVVPLVARGRTTGTMSLASGSRQYTAEDIVFAEDLARRAALAIDNADLFSQTQRAAETLQHALLPQRLPELKGWDLATLYQPSGRAEVGGDFFDVIDLMTDRYVAVIGDVMGRGVDAAATAARLQAAVRALVAADPDLRAVAAGLDRMLALSSEQPLVTLVLMAFGRRDRQRRRARRRAPAAAARGPGRHARPLAGHRLAGLRGRGRRSPPRAGRPASRRRRPALHGRSRRAPRRGPRRRRRPPHRRGPPLGRRGPRPSAYLPRTGRPTGSPGRTGPSRRRRRHAGGPPLRVTSTGIPGRALRGSLDVSREPLGTRVVGRMGP